MSLVYVVGNVVKDVYLQLDDRKDNFEKDSDGRPWLDLVFDGSSHYYVSRSSIFGGARITKEVLTNFGVDAEIATTSQTADVYRYVLCRGDDITYLTSSERPETTWSSPTDIASWIFVDRSAEVSNDLVNGIKAYLSLSGRTRLATFFNVEDAPKTWTHAERELLKLSNLIFTDGELPDDTSYTGLVCSIGRDHIQIGSVRRFWQVENANTLTRLTGYSIIAASILGSLLRGKKVSEALDYAKVNVENSALNKTLSLGEIDARAKELADRRKDLPFIAKTMMAKGKGILAADESMSSIKKKFASAGVENTSRNRRDYRDLFIATPGVENYLSGVILFDETTHQLADDGRDYVSYLTSKGIVPGIKVDLGLEPFPEKEIGDDRALPTDELTSGLDGLSARLHAYYQNGLRFAKWRAAFRIDASRYAIRENARRMAAYAKACQEEGLVPIVEPELLMDGDYNIDDSAIVTSKILDILFDELERSRVDLSACILKVNMVIGGTQREISSPEAVGEKTAEVLKSHVPKNLAGVVFLSGGQTPEQSTENLASIMNHAPYPWPVTFSFARALQDPALSAWGGYDANKSAARDAFLARLKANVAALKS